MKSHPKTNDGCLAVALAFLIGLVPPAHATTAPTIPALADGEKFAREIEARAAAGDLRFYFDAYDWDAILATTLAGQQLDTKDREKMLSRLKQAMDEVEERQAQDLVGLRLLRVKPDAGGPRAVFRVHLANGSACYQDLILGTGRDGKVRIVDAYLYYTGEKLTESYKRILLPALAEKNRSVFARFFLSTPELVKYAPQWSRLPKLRSEGKYREAMEVYAGLPKSLQKEKFILLQQLKAAQAAPDEKAWLAATDLWQRTYPRDPALDFIGLNSHLLRGEYPQAIECLDRLDKSVGGDPYIDVQRAWLFLQMNDVAKARAAARRAFERDPSLIEAGLFEVLLQAKERKYDQCVEQLSKIQAASGCSKEQLMNAMERSGKFIEFARSAQYRKWRGPMLYIAGSRVPQSTPAGSRPDGLILQGIIYRQPGASATINGQFVAVGDVISDFKVVAIEPKSVTLQSASGEQKILVMRGSAE